MIITIIRTCFGFQIVMILCLMRFITYLIFISRVLFMKGLDWAWLYDKYGIETLDTAALGKRISELMRDSEIQKQSGIIPFVLTGDERYLDLRAFPEDIKLAVWEKQNHICPLCGKEFDFEFMEGDHITPWREGGRTVAENCQMLCRECNRRKGAK